MSSPTMAFIPLRKGTKKPALANWNQRENCVIEFENYQRLQGFDLALADAFCEPPVGCLDIDNYELAQPILMSLGFDSEAADTTTDASAFLRFLTFTSKTTSISIRYALRLQTVKRCPHSCIT